MSPAYGNRPRPAKVGPAARIGRDLSNLSTVEQLNPADRKAERKPVAERLYRQNMTMEQIAKQLGVSQRQISTDLSNLEVTSKSKRAKTATNPRPPPRTAEQIAIQLGVTNQTISNDLREFPNHLKTQPRTSKRGRNGEGRPAWREPTDHQPRSS